MKTGIFVRIEREDKFQNLDITELTNSEIENLFEDKDKHDVLQWLIAMIELVRFVDVS